MIIITLDLITFNNVCDLDNSPFVIEGEGDLALKIFFESEESKKKYLSLPMPNGDAS